MTLAQRLAEAMDAKGKTAADLQRATNIPQSTISELRSGKTKRPAASTLEPIAKELGVTAAWLLTGKGDRFGNGGAPRGGHPEIGAAFTAGVRHMIKRTRRFLDEVERNLGEDEDGGDAGTTAPEVDLTPED